MEEDEEKEMHLLSVGWEFLNFEPRQQVVTTVHGIYAATNDQQNTTLH